jgi:hypothetical protein
LTRSPQGENFSMGCRVFVTLSAILSGCNEVTISVNDNSTYGHFSRITCCLGECDRLTHPLPMN